MTASSRSLELSCLPQRFAVVRMAADAAIPSWATQGKFFCVARTADELSIVLEESLVPAGEKSQAGWRNFKLHGPIAFTETGVLSSLLTPLADAKIGVFAISTFDTDYLLVAAENLAAAIATLEQSGHKILRS